MTDAEINDRFALLADAVSRVAEVGSTGMQDLRQTLDRFITVSTTRFNQQDERIQRLVDVQLATQHQMGNLSQVVLEIREEVRQLQQRQLQIEQRQSESDQRFEVILQEIRYLIRHNGGSES